MINNFKFSFNEKRYHTFNYYLKTTYHKKVAKIIIDGHFTCPNRDGKKSFGGCYFCSKYGSGDSNISIGEDVIKQYHTNKQLIENKWNTDHFIAYFQSFSNTYGSISKIKSMIDPFLYMDEVKEISIGTRVDCIEDDVLDYLDNCSKIKPITIEVGLQTTNSKTSKYLNLQYDFNDFKHTLSRLNKTNLKVCVHIINGLPYESKDDMIQTIKDLSSLKFDAIKIHMLHIIKDSILNDIYQIKPFDIISRDMYIEIVCQQLRYLNPNVVVQRLTGDPIKEDLVAPTWTLNKTTILNDIDKLMYKLDIYQGDLYNI